MTFPVKKQILILSQHNQPCIYLVSDQLRRDCVLHPPMFLFSNAMKKIIMTWKRQLQSKCILFGGLMAGVTTGHKRTRTAHAHTHVKVSHCQKKRKDSTFKILLQLWHTHTTTGSTYRCAGLAGEDSPSLSLVHVEVLEVGLIDLPGQGLLVSQSGVLHIPLSCHHLRLQLQFLWLRHATEANGCRK